MHRVGIPLAGIYALAGACAAWAQSVPAASPGATPIQTIIEYPIPTASSQPTSIVTGPDGNLWFTEMYASKIGRITPAGAITEYATPTPWAGPAGIAKGADGNLWFAENYGSNIAKISTSGSITEYPVPAGGPYGITLGPDGNIWFVDSGSGDVGKITPGGVVTVYQCQTYGICGLDYSIAAGPGNSLLVAPSIYDNLGEISTSGVFSIFGGSGFQVWRPETVLVGPDGNVWVATNGGGIRVIIPPGTDGAGARVIAEFGPNYANEIAVGPDGNIWFNGGLGLGRISLSGGGVTNFPTIGLFGPGGLAAGPDGNVWFADDATNSIGTLLLSTTPPSSTPTLSPSSLTFSGVAGGSAPASQTLTVSAANPTAFTESSFNNGTPTNTPWLSVSPSGTLNTNQTITASADPTGLPSGTYTAWINITSGFVTQTLMATLNLSAAGGNVIPSATAFNFAYTTGGTAPSPFGLTITSASGSNNATPYTISTSVTSPSGGNWLALAINGTAIPNRASETTPTSFAVSVNPTGLSSGVYTGAIAITPSGGTAVTIPVTLTVSAPVTPVLTGSPSALNFSYQMGIGSSTVRQSLQVNNQTGTIVSFTATATSSPSGWLSVSPSPGDTSYPIGVYASVAGLAPGNYSGSIVITPTVTGIAAITVPVTLTIIAPPVSISPSALTFTYPGGSPPASQSIQVSATGTAAVSFTAQSSNINWLSVTPTSGATPATLLVSVSPGALTAGAYSGTITVNTGTGNWPTPVGVTLTVTAGATISVNPTPVSFTYQIGGNSPGSYSIQATAPGNGAVSFTAAASNSGNWLSVTPSSGTTPATLVLSASPTGLAVGTYTGNITITANTVGNPQTVVPVTLMVTPATISVINPNGLHFYYTTGNSLPASQSIQVIASGSATVSYTAAKSDNANWLSITPASGTTPGTLAVSVSPAGLAPAAAFAYTASIVITPGSNGSPQIVVPVTLTVNSLISVSPSAMNFSYQTGGSLPGSQSAQVTASGNAAVSFTADASSTGNWLSVTPASGTTPATLAVSVSPAGLPPGFYSGLIYVVPGAGVTPQSGFWVVLTVSNGAPTGATVSVNPTSLNFAYQTGSSPPTAQSIQVSASGNAAVAITAAASSTGNWLSVAPASGTTPATLAVAVSPTGLAAGTYSGAIVVNGTSIAVSLSVTTSPSASQPTISSVLSAASYSNGAVSPGEMVSIFGALIGPANPAFLTLDSMGRVSTSIGGVTVSFAGHLAPLTYVGSSQINAVVPYEIAGNSSPSVEVTYAGQTSNSQSLQLAATTPAIFTQNSSGTGPGAILNQDYSLNTQANPAAPGSVVQIYMTGEGLTTPVQTTGTVTPVNTSGVGPVTPAPQQSISVLIGGQPAKLDFAGEAPYFVAGVLQVNAELPSTVSSGAIPIMVRVGNQISQSGVTVWVK